jgi:hypothetical protein
MICILLRISTLFTQLENTYVDQHLNNIASVLFVELGTYIGRSRLFATPLLLWMNGKVKK